MVFRLLFCLLLSCAAWSEVSTEQEVALGRSAAQKIEARSGIDNSPDLNRRLQTIGQALARVCGRNDIQFQFKVLATDEFNAMALPGGFVYATRSLLRGMSDGEIAFVLGHEISHVVQRHSINQMENEQKRKVGWLAVLVSLSGGRIDQQSVQAAAVLDQMLGSRFSQADESEADRLGTAMMARAGYDPAYALVALRTLAGKHTSQTPDFINAMVGSHPMPQDRITDSYKYIPPLAFRAGVGTTPVSPVRTSSLLNRLTQAVVQSSGWKQDPHLMSSCRGQLEHMNLDAEGFLLVSPAGESDNALERRLLTLGVAQRVMRGGVSRFGLASRDGSEGERLVWLKVR
ncbi:MAG: M48 family metalloprotease [Candidatus Eremiobacteraeota bacterium]|nr:M48 family metalloprotease [Candidatus Eremiobacteraeota bacterium]MCW5868144.1 M48 family metalloprotease [Candidatus Eremiobacteraeota bacterium]